MSLKHLLQGTAIGLFIATSVFSAVYFFGPSGEGSNKNVSSIDDAIALLESEQYSVITDEELERLHDEIRQLERILEETYQEDLDEVDDEGTNEENDTDEIADEVDDSTDEEEEVREFVLKIEAGMHSRNIGEVLKKYGIVEDERDFERYVLELGVDRRIQIGEFKLTSNMTMDDIVKIITNP